MKLQIEVSYDAGRLAKRMPTLINDFLAQASAKVAKDAVGEIDGGKFAPLATSTIRRRQQRGNTSTKPLVDTGALRGSIKQTKNEVEMKRYGIYHQHPQPRVPARPFLLRALRKGLNEQFKNFITSIRKTFHRTTPSTRKF